jgi:hypothetical protein
MKTIRYLTLILIFVFLGSADVFAQPIPLSASDMAWIGAKIFKNECDSNQDCLLSWNKGEEFLSLGVGHFIWYPENYEGPFEESFPKFLTYLKSRKEKMPFWLYITGNPKCPWRTREQFYSNPKDSKVDELYRFLNAIKDKQVDFMIKRLEDAIPLLLKSAPVSERTKLRENFYGVASTPAGIYALVDYINFKGLGVYPQEKYQGQGWGLLQVLLKMKAGKTKEAALTEFSKVAERLLVQRVHNSPPERQEKKWLLGWRNRVHSYLAAQEEWQLHKEK